MSNSLGFSRIILPRLTVSLILVFGAIGGAAPAWAWGDLGHKIVCQIAFHELNVKARAEVVRLIALDEKFDAFTDATMPSCAGESRMAPAQRLICPGSRRGESSRRSGCSAPWPSRSNSRGQKPRGFGSVQNGAPMKPAVLRYRPSS
jgi:hypothetical protein